MSNPKPVNRNPHNKKKAESEKEALILLLATQLRPETCNLYLSLH